MTKQIRAYNGCSLTSVPNGYEAIEKMLKKVIWRTLSVAPQTRLGSARNLAKTCFRPFPTFRYSTPKFLLFGKHFGSNILFFANFS